jgi:hypothetical protein
MRGARLRLGALRVSGAGRVFLAAFVLLVVLPLAASCVVAQRPSDVPWYLARRDSSGQAPDPATTPQAVIQVYAARAVGWRGIFGVHTWIALKEEGAPRWTRYEVIGFGVERGVPSVRIDRMGPDNYWFGARPELLLDKRGPEAASLIGKVREAVGRYPWPDFYRVWPGPNSNTFTAFIAREVPELGLVLPSTAVGKDFLPGVAAGTPSGSGFQVSLWGVLGLSLGASEGIELNVLGLVVGIDLARPALKLPGIGRLGVPRSG